MLGVIGAARVSARVDLTARAFSDGQARQELGQRSGKGWRPGAEDGHPQLEDHHPGLQDTNPHLEDRRLH
jgi:hypothetical protein